LKKQNNIIFTGTRKSVLYVLNLDDFSEREVKIQSIYSPWALCLGPYDEIYVCCSSYNDIIVVLDSNMNFKRTFTIDKIHDNHSVEKISIDLTDENKNLLYVTYSDKRPGHFISNNVLVFDNQTGVFLHEIEIKAPKFMIFDKDFFYVSGEEYNSNFDTNNFVYKLNKTNYEIVEKLMIGSGMSLKGLNLDLENLCVAAQKDNSKCRNLDILFKDSDEFIKSIEINDIPGPCWDVFLFDDKMVILSYSIIRLIVFK
jgi:hypothetical protein